VRWERLFADLEAQFVAARRDERTGEIDERSRRELARVSVLDRLRAATGARVGVDLGPAGTVDGEVVRVGPDWLLLAAGRAEVLVVAEAVIALTGLPAAADDPSAVAGVDAAWRIGLALRGLARDRRPVVVVLRTGTTVTGTLDRVGADFVDVAEHPVDEPRRAAAVRRVRTVPVAALAAVRSG
jgi:hypothetical protein